MKKKYHHKKEIWIYGKHAVKAALNNENRHIFRIISLESSKSFLSPLIKKCNLKIEIVDKLFFDKLFEKYAIHQGCAALLKENEELSIEDVIEDPNDNRPIVFLDRITDPQNIGSILRASAVFGARALVLTENNSPELTPAIAKSASGALEVVPIVRITNLVSTLKILKSNDFWIVGLDERADQEIHQIDLNSKIAFVIGSEGNGMRRLTTQTCDFIVKLPFHDNFSTLNAAQAATISLYEQLKQRRSSKC